ncbi:MAG: redoxin domain-containing protein [Clostridia bacterium]|nr:redoxin domain-containing protein [Clostridia bacterium]
MKEWIKWLIIALLLVGLVVCATIIYNHFSKDYNPNQLVIDTPSDSNGGKDDNGEANNVKPAPDFTVLDKDGNEVTLGSLKGKPVIVNFWATWCPYCVQEMPDFEEAYKSYSEDIHFMMINVTDGYQETLESAKSYISEYKYSFPVYYDTKLSASLAYGAYSLPCTFFIDADGNLDSHILGMIPKETLQAGIDRLLK